MDALFTTCSLIHVLPHQTYLTCPAVLIGRAAAAEEVLRQPQSQAGWAAGQNLHCA